MKTIPKLPVPSPPSTHIQYESSNGEFILVVFTMIWAISCIVVQVIRIVI